ncbi:hypothetical protein V565_067520 [Rhizoctonia solani 123E]|uniref:Uncharacterized protein n=1 Tax=Rhizoctonia solani 123E TaxID=1423351 RepID=A0A074SM06_9AGAM|nr:hypothetical protein V565_067520 [Rhizoctonia solani 123E]
MLIYAPNENGRLEIAQDIHSCATDQDVLELGQSFFKYFVHYCKCSPIIFKAVDNISTSPLPPPLIDSVQNQIPNSITPTTHSEARTDALIRDNYRCMLSQKVDIDTYRRSPFLQVQLGLSPPPDVDQTECCHILPYITSDLQESKENISVRTTCATIFTALERFGGISHLERNQHGPHHLTNIMTLQTGLRKNFDRLQLWLDPVEGVDNTYTIGRQFPGLRLDLPQTVTFTTSTPGFPLPDRRYLALHAACARVIHLSGATEAISSIIEEMEQTRVLSEDGSSAALLEYLWSMDSAVFARW